MAVAPRLLLISTDAERRTHWSAALRRQAQTLSLDDVVAGSDAPLPDILLTDHLPVDRLPEPLLDLLTRGEIGLVALGAGGPADVVLPADATDRELRLACQLLYEIVRLRRRWRRHERRRKILEHLAEKDPLTGLANRRVWDHRLDEQWRSTRQTQGSLCVALFDVDSFKRVNDLVGHAVGDKALRGVADALVGAIREHDLAARLGGDEFGILLPGVSGQQARQVVDRIRRGLACDSGHVQVGEITCSAGFAVLEPGDPVAIDQLVCLADESLRRAKQAGRNQTDGGETE